MKDAKSGKAVQQGAVEITDNELGIVVASFDTYLETGRFMISLPAGKSYGVSVRSKGYLVYTENLSTKSNGQYQERDMTIQLNKLDASVAQVTEVAATRKAGKQPTDMVLNTVYFDFGRTNLTDKAIAEIDRVLNILKQNAEMKLIVSGHTDSIGVPIYNQHLSEIRAKVVVDYLVSKGISKKRLTAIGYGSQFPMASNTTRSGRAQNRRAEFDKKEN
ncbi:MAG: OmpA family protein [Prevotellaceae bacterium]|nr:OmpA family protein [Prevotellaceae bacterium]